MQLRWGTLSSSRRTPPPRARRASAADVRRDKARRRRRRRIARVSTLATFSLLILAALGGLAWADRASADKIPAGVTVRGIDVGGLTRGAALDRLEQRIGTPSRRPVTVAIQGRTEELTADEAGVRVDLAGAIDDALASGRDGNFLARGWRSVTGGAVHADVPANVTVDRAAVKGFVGGLAKQVAKPAVNAELSLTAEHVAVKPGREGRRLAGSGKLERRIVRAFGTPDAQRRLKARTAAVEPAVTEKEVWARNPTIVTVAHDERVVRVFRRGEVTARYRVAVGDPEFPTPRGSFVVQSKQENPTWNVPDSEWAGDLAGEVIPGGDPRNPLVARWIGFSGSVGFHGTKDIASLGNAASHGCVRMNPKDVIDLFDRVEVGTTVLVA
jgi:lipoprotein-anchoring transpeptidase ErfK/SrfK